MVFRKCAPLAFTGSSSHLFTILHLYIHLKVDQDTQGSRPNCSHFESQRLPRRSQPQWLGRWSRWHLNKPRLELYSIYIHERSALSLYNHIYIYIYVRSPAIARPPLCSRAFVRTGHLHLHGLSASLGCAIVVSHHQGQLLALREDVPRDGAKSDESRPRGFPTSASALETAPGPGSQKCDKCL